MFRGPPRGSEPIKRIALFLATNLAIAALKRLAAAHSPPLPDQMAAFGIRGGIGQGLRRLFMTHPPIEERIAVLERGAG